MGTFFCLICRSQVGSKSQQLLKRRAEGCRLFKNATPNNKFYDEREFLPSKTERSSRKVRYGEHERAALNRLGAPLMLTLTGRKRLTVDEWLQIMASAIKTCAPGLALRIDAFKQPRDRSVHVAIWNLPAAREHEVVIALEHIRREACAFSTKSKGKHGRRFLVQGLSLAYMWAHEELGSQSVAT